MMKTDTAYQYIRLLRTQMLNSELLLVALNCALDKGKAKFKPLIERYALLHNMNPFDVRDFSLNSLFEPEAFGVTELDREEAFAELSAAEQAAQ